MRIRQRIRTYMVNIPCVCVFCPIYILIIYLFFIWCVYLCSQRAPVFVELLNDRKVMDGDSVLLSCTVSGQPRAQITWLRDDDEINDDQVSLIILVTTTLLGAIVTW